MFTVMQILLNSVMFASIISLATLGIILVFKTSTTTNFAQGMIATVGAFISTFLLVSYGVPRLLSMLIAFILMFAFGVLIDIGLFRRAKFMTPIGKQMITMGIVLFLLGVIPLIFGNAIVEAPRFSNEVLRFVIGGQQLSISMHSAISFVIAMSIIVVVFVALKFTRWGLAVRATASNENVARMMGINTTVITAVSWGLAGLIGSMAAIMFAPTTYLTSAMMIGIQVTSFMACILGGFSSFYGPVIAALFLPFVSNLIGYYLVGSWKDAVVYLLIFLIVLIKPVGLFGKKTIKKV